MELSWKITSKHDKWLVRDYLLDVRAFSDRLLKSVKRNGKILVNGEEVTVRKQLNQGDEIIVIFGQEKRGKGLKSVKMPLNIVYEDEHYIVISKPRGIAIMNDGERATLVDGVLAYFDEKNLPFTVHVITRLDRDTSGIVIIAKHRYAHHLLQPEQISREYLAIIEGTMSKKKGTINLPIRRSPSSIIERIVTEKGKEAITKYEVIKENGQYSLLKLNLLTGRTHQIRVHLSHIGYPIVGDELYGGKLTMIEGQALHCYKISFIHPFLNIRLTFVANIPKEIENIIK